MDTETMQREAAAMSSVVAPENAELAENVVMRPMTGGSASICVLTNNRVYRALIDNRPIEDLGEFELLAFLYIHCAPLQTVRRMALNPALWQQAVLEWGENLPFAVLLGAKSALEQSREILASVRFDVEPKPAKGDPESPPPN
ncbi:MAG: hypothetical protein FGM15_05315 [Chthoniobacterales bacterium]|nr:hypothetical protein [Chthoniobacterales bacterium]